MWRHRAGRTGGRRIAVTAVVLAAFAGCGSRGLSRDGLRDAYVARIAGAGIGRAVAECVVDRLFDEMTDDELRRFNTDGTSLTEAESARIAQLADACGA